MSCMEDLERFITPNDVIITLTEIYRYNGLNEKFSQITSSDIEKIIDQTIERDAFFLAKILGLKISDSRMRLIIKKRSSARNREETILFNVVEVLADIQMNYSKYTLQSNDLINMINYIYSDQNIKFDITKEERRSISQKSKRTILEELNEKFTQKRNQVEKITMALNYFIDLYNLKPFTAQNKTIAFIVLYLLMLKADVNSFKYISFFEMIKSNERDFNDALRDASFNWNEGMHQTLNFIRQMTLMILRSWERAEKIIKDYNFDQKIKKSFNIENTVSNLNDIFTKDQIRIIHPYVSETTINRALQKMRDEKKIKPLGKGRSAKWVKISTL